MKTILVLAVHGAPPRDFPRAEMGQLFALHGQLEHAAGPERETLARRYDALHRRMQEWPRTAQNDPFWAASLELAAQLGQATGLSTLVGFNEFCAPDLDATLTQAVAEGAQRIIVTTPMLTPGGEHAEQDIPAAIARVKATHAGIEFAYAWPFPLAEVARFLAAQIATIESGGQ